MTAVLFLGAAPAVGAPAEILDVGGTPLGVVVGSDGTAYVGDYGAGGIRVIPPGASRPSRTLSTGINVSGIALAPDGTLYAAAQDSATGEAVVGVIPPGAAGVVRSIPVSDGNHLIAAGPDGTVFVPNPSEGTVSVIAPNGSAVDRIVTVGAGPVEVAVTKDGTAFVTNQYGGTVSVIPAGANTVSRTIQVSSTPGRTENPHGIAAGPDGTIYVTNISSNDVAVIKPGADTVAYRIYVPGGPTEAAVGPDGTLYVASALTSRPVRNTARGHSDRPLHPDREQPRSPRGSSGRDHHRDDPGQRRGKRFRGPLRHRRCSCGFGPRPSLGTGIRRDPTRRRGDNPVELPGRNRWNGRSSSSRHRPAHRGHATPANGVPSRPRQRVRGTPRRSPQRRFLERARRCRPKQVIWPERA